MRTKKNFIIKLVNIHKLKFFITILIGLIQISSAYSQVWTLHQCIDTAKIYNKNIQTEKNDIVFSKQKQNESRANLLPKVVAVADYRYFFDLPYQLMPQSAFGGPEGQFKETQFGVPHNINASIQATIPLYNPQVYGAIKTTTIASELAELKYLKTEEQVVFEISNLYYNAQILYHQLNFIDSNLVNTSKLLENIKLLNEHQLAKEVDVTKVQLQLEQLGTQREVIFSKYEAVIYALKFSMGISLDQNVLIETNINYQKENQNKESLIVDVQIVDAKNRLLRSELNTLRNSRLPSLSLYGTYGTTGFGYDQKPNDFLKFFPVSFIGIQLTYPLFNGTITKKRINQKQIELQNNKLQMDLVIDQNTMLISNAERQKVVSQKSVENTLSQISLAQKVYKQTFVQQKEGVASITEILLADNALREAQQNYINALVDYLKADLELKKLTGNISTRK